MARKSPESPESPGNAENTVAAPPAGTPRPDFPLAGRTGMLLHKAGKLIEEEVDRALVAAGFRLRTFLALAALAGGPELSQQDLSRVLNLDPTTMVALIDELERAGRVERRRNPADRRRYILVLTEPGRQALAEAEAVATEAERAFFAELTGPQRDQLHGMLALLMAHRWPSSICL
ncbi:MarR family winged helix-turn-helix transcriptional regulator [Kitasatospora sp. NPDC052896]|uniref:MarR family winged helix-turn-helix transcriptional regulator n=1 Tax=Kitasatospora sp. NPDC052896 TaxID=3364061 RepID=UPI0037CA4685